MNEIVQIIQEAIEDCGDDIELDWVSHFDFDGAVARGKMETSSAARLAKGVWSEIKRQLPGIISEALRGDDWARDLVSAALGSDRNGVHWPGKVNFETKELENPVRLTSTCPECGNEQLHSIARLEPVTTDGKTVLEFQCCQNRRVKTISFAVLVQEESETSVHRYEERG